MLKKLLKYDFKCSARKIIPITIVYLAVTLVTTLFLNFGDDDNMLIAVLGAMFSTAFGFMTFGMAIFGYGISVGRFKKNYYSDEGYLMNTLPVTAKSLILSKLLNSLIWGVISGVVSFAGIMIMMIGDGFKEFIRAMEMIIKEIFSSPSSVVLALTMLINVVVFYAAITVLFFFDASFENAFAFARKKWFKVASICLGFSIGMTVAVFGIDYLGGAIVDFIESFELSEAWTGSIILGISALVGVAVFSALFVAVNKLMVKRLNLE